MQRRPSASVPSMLLRARAAPSSTDAARELFERRTTSGEAQRRPLRVSALSRPCRRLEPSSSGDAQHSKSRVERCDYWARGKQRAARRGASALIEPERARGRNASAARTIMGTRPARAVFRTVPARPRNSRVSQCSTGKHFGFTSEHFVSPSEVNSYVRTACSLGKARKSPPALGAFLPTNDRLHLSRSSTAFAASPAAQPPAVHSYGPQWPRSGSFSLAVFLVLMRQRREPAADRQCRMAVSGRFSL